MKTIIAIVVALMVTLIAGVAYAASDEGELFNGITYFETGTTPNCAYVVFSAAGGYGGVIEVEATAVPENGISLMEPGIPGSGANGLCAGHPDVVNHTEMRPNGITVMDSAM